jgi:hypothetical protein
MLIQYCVIIIMHLTMLTMSYLKVKCHLRKSL